MQTEVIAPQSGVPVRHCFGTGSLTEKQSALIILYFAGFSTQLGFGIITPAIPVYAQIMGATGFWIGLIIASFSVSKTLFLSFFGGMSDACGRRTLLIVGMSGFSLFSALYVLATTVQVLVIIRFFTGIFAAMVFPVAVAYVGDLAETGEEGKLMGEFNSISYLGMSFGPLIGGLLMDYAGYSSAFLFLAFIIACGAAIVLFRLPDYRPVIKGRPAALRAFRHPLLVIPVLFYCVYSVTYVAFLFYIPLIAHDADGLSATGSGMLLLIGMLAMAGTQKISGRFADRFDKYLLLSIGISIIACGALCMACTGCYPVLLGGIVLFGMGLGLSLTTVCALVTIAGRDIGQGSAAAAVNVVQGICFITVPVIFGLLMDSAGIVSVFLVTGIVAFSAVPFLIVCKKRLRKKFLPDL